MFFVGRWLEREAVQKRAERREYEAAGAARREEIMHVHRHQMIRKARRMLRTPERLVLPPAPSGEGATLGGASRGLLLLVDTMSIDGRKSNRQNGGYIQQWIEAVESEGFAFIRHQVLSRSHALVFATAPMPTAETLAREPPELRMRREERADGWDHANEQSRGRKATAATPPGEQDQVTPPPGNES